jgi:hypothetical protein
VVVALWLAPQAAGAQMFTEQPPPVPPAAVPGADGAGAASLAPSTGGFSSSDLPAQLIRPPAAALPLTAPLQSLPLAAPHQGVLALAARFGKDQPLINGGLIWRIYADKPDPATGAFKLIREDRSATPQLSLPPGNYIIHVGLGLASAVRTIGLHQDTVRELFDLPAGGLRIEGRVGSTKIPPNQISFGIYKGSQFDVGEREPLVSNVAVGEVVMLPEGTYHIISNYGDGNSVVRSDIRVQIGKLTDVTVTHRAAVITLKLVSEKGGEAMANTAWSVLTPGGDVVKESIGAFPHVVLSEGDYRAVARNEGRVYERPFNVVNGVDGDVEVLAR